MSTACSKERTESAAGTERKSDAWSPYIELSCARAAGNFEAAEKKCSWSSWRISAAICMRMTASNGQVSIADVAAAAKAEGYAYLAISDHSQHTTIAHGLDARRLARQLAEIDRLNGELAVFGS